VLQVVNIVPYSQTSTRPGRKQTLHVKPRRHCRHGGTGVTWPTSIWRHIKASCTSRTGS